MSPQTIIRAFKRNWRHKPVSSIDEQVKFTYVNKLHDVHTDAVIELNELIYAALDDLPEGEIVEITIRPTGEQAPQAQDPWVLLAPNQYGPNSQARK